MSLATLQQCYSLWGPLFGAGGASRRGTEELSRVVSNVGWLDGSGLENKVSSVIRHGRSSISTPSAIEEDYLCES
jgi:hypothetical protein